MPNGDEFREDQPRQTMGNYNVSQYPGTTGANPIQGDMINTGHGGVSVHTTRYGLESLTADSFMKDDGTPKPLSQIVDLLMKHKPYNKTEHGGTERQYRKDMERKVLDMMPKLQKVSEKEKAFLRGETTLASEERDLAMTKAKDAYGRAEDTYGLSTRGAERGLGTALGQAQGQASSLGGAMRGAYGGGSMGMRGAIGGQQTLAKGVESTYGGYQDKMIGAQQQLGYAGQALGYAETAGDIGRKRAQLAEDKGMYGLEEGVKGEFEADIGTFLDNFQQGGRVPTFSDILSKIPDAGGS